MTAKRTHIAHMPDATRSQIRGRKNKLREKLERIVRDANRATASYNRLAIKSLIDEYVALEGFRLENLNKDAMTRPFKR